MSFINLQAHYVVHGPGGMRVGSPSKTVQMGNGAAVEVPLLWVAIDNELAVAPVIAVDGESAIRVDLSSWTPMYVSPELAVLLPVRFADLAEAVRATRAFDADPAISWRASDDDKVRWLESWLGVKPSTTTAGGA